MPLDSSFSFDSPDPAFEIDLESEDWFRLPESSAPVLPLYWPDPVYGGARRASEEDLRPMLFPPDEPSAAHFRDVSLILGDGCLWKQSLFLNSELRSQNLLISSITGGGKTQKYILPLLIHDFLHGVPTLSLDTKCEQYELLRQLPNARGRLMIWNPMDPTRSTVAINVLEACGDDPGMWLNVGQLFVQANTTASNEDENWFDQNASSLIAGVGMAIRKKLRARVCFADILQVLEWSQKRLKEFLEVEEVPFIGSIMSFMASGSHNAETVFATARNALRLFIDKGVAAATSVSEFTLKNLVRGRKTLIIEVLPEHSAYVRPILNLFFTTLLDDACKLARQFPGNYFPNGLRFYIDDFAANVGRIPNLDDRLNIMRSRNFGVTASVQTLGQIEDLYETKSAAVLAGFSSKIFQSPVDLTDADYAARLSGTTTIAVTEFSEQMGGLGAGVDEIGLTRTRRPQASPLYLPDEIRLAPEHFIYGRAATCFFAGLAPFQAWFRSAWDVPENRRIFAAVRKVSFRKLRRKPLKWQPLPEDVFTASEKQPLGITDTTGWSQQRLKTKMLELLELVINKKDPNSIIWWHSFCDKHRESTHILVRVLEELMLRKSTLTDLLYSVVYCNSESIEVALAFLDYRNLRKKHEQRAVQKETGTTKATANEPSLLLTDLVASTGIEVILDDLGPNAGEVAKVVKSLTGMSRKRANNLLRRSLPVTLGYALTTPDANDAADQLQDVGCEVRLRPAEDAPF
jgi:type IV secretory pathway TraG/TraD family ATPase VirD4/ribosomal protein L7/L12